MNQNLKIICGATVPLLLIAGLAIKNSNPKPPIVEASVTDFQIKGIQLNLLKVTMNPFSKATDSVNVNQLKGGAVFQMPPSIPNQNQAYSMPNAASLFPKIGNSPALATKQTNEQSSSLSVISIMYSNTSQKAILKVNNNEVEVTPGFTGNGYKVVSIEKNGLYVTVNDKTNFLKYGND